ncbi:MAG: hypothetical protein F4223_03295 [Rhodobacteraceae bacterium]|nr:hypothetical protein [Paracoccaceae bacterium]
MDIIYDLVASPDWFLFALANVLFWGAITFKVALPLAGFVAKYVLMGRRVAQAQVVYMSDGAVLETDTETGEVERLVPADEEHPASKWGSGKERIRYLLGRRREAVDPRDFEPYGWPPDPDEELSVGERDQLLVNTIALSEANMTAQLKDPTHPHSPVKKSAWREGWGMATKKFRVLIFAWCGDGEYPHKRKNIKAHWTN